MAAERNIITEAVAAWAKDHGFRRKASTYYLRQTETIAVVNLQRSHWGGGVYYINVALWLLALGAADSPREHHCHVRIRLGDFLPEWTDCVPIFDLDLVIDDDSRRIAIARMLDTYALPFLLQWDTIQQGLAGSIGADKLWSHTRGGDAYELLGIDAADVSERVRMARAAQASGA